jgi:hypothetical protein
MTRGKDRDHGIFFRDLLWSTRQLRGKRSMAIGDELLRVIQNDQMTAALGILEKPVVMLMEIRSNRVGSRADDNRVQLIQCFGVEIRPFEELHAGTQLTNRCGDLVANSHNVSNSQRVRQRHCHVSEDTVRVAKEIARL